MAEQSLISAIVSNKVSRVDSTTFKPRSADKLDVVLEPFRSSEKKKESSLKKLAVFSPTNLKNLQSNAQKTSIQRKQSLAIREAEASLVTNKVRTTKENNPFNNIPEKQAGRHLNVLA